MATVTPWEVKGNIDYDKLIKQFGVSPISSQLHRRIIAVTGQDSHFLRRGIFFAHRDLDKVLDEYEKGNHFFLYTGRAPSGKVHIGHLFVWYFTKWLQDAFDVELYFQFPDEEKFLIKEGMSFEQGQEYLQDNMLDVAAVGFNPKKTHFIIDTQHAHLLYPQAVRIAKHITFSTVKATFGFGNDQNIGAIFYTSMQAAPTVLPSVLKGKPIPCLIPHAIDQDPHFRISRDVNPKLGYPKPASIQGRFLPGLGGFDEQGKMSSSAQTTSIYATDSPAEVKKKINKYAFSGGQPTIEEHRAKGGNADIDVAFQYLYMFLEPDDKRMEALRKSYKEGTLLTGELKAIAIEKINTFLAEHQKRRATVDLKQYILKA